MTPKRLALLATASLLIAACGQPAPQPDETELALPVPPAEDEAPVVEAASDTAEPADAAHSEGDDHSHDTAADHHEHDDHGHDDAEHDHEHDEDHAHHDDDHDHHDHDDHHHDHDHDGVGEAHVHGVGDLAVTRSGDQLTLTLEAPLANFSLAGSTRTLPDDFNAAGTSFTLLGDGGCTAEPSTTSIRAIGDHGNLTVTQVYSCTDIAAVSGVRVTAFEAYPGFETVNAIFLDENRQVPALLDPDNTDLSLR